MRGSGGTVESGCTGQTRRFTAEGAAGDDGRPRYATWRPHLMIKQSKPCSSIYCALTFNMVESLFTPAGWVNTCVVCAT